MLQGLFGNKNLERILLFIFVNERCYASQLQTLLATALSPIQNALNRLETAGILQSHFEGKSRIYEFHPSYPLLSELENLLKKAYTLLPTQEKKLYCFIHKPRLKLQEERTRDQTVRSELLAFWNRLSQTQRLIFSAKEKAQSISKTGHAEVLLQRSADSLIFQEKGHWLSDEPIRASFSNVFRWSLSLDRGMIALEHLRYGNDRPVFLFHLTATGQGILESIDSHLCAADTYLGHIIWNKRSIDFHWRIIGPQKNSELIYRYN